MKQYLKTIVYLAAALVSVACSSGGDNDPSSFTCSSGEDGDNDHYSFKLESYNGVVSRGNSYEGIWMVNDVKAEAADVSINYYDTEVQGDALPSTATFFGFPFQAITDLVMPGATVSSIPNSIAMYYSSMDPQSIFYQVILKDGKEVGITVHMVTEKSSVILNSEGGTFSCIIPVDKIICSESAGFKEIPFDPEMQLRYTSINRVKGSTVGN